MIMPELLRLTALIRVLRVDACKKAVQMLDEMCFLEGVLHQSVETLSKGYRHRTCFAQSIIHDPEVLILDEPTDGLDPNQKHEVRTLIRTMGRTKAIIFSTHILEEVEAACSRAIIIDRGQIVANGTPEELKQRSTYAGAVTLRIADGSVAPVRQKLEQIPGVAKCAVLSETPVALRAFAKNNGRDLARAIGELAAAERWKIEELHTDVGRLDEVFRSITLPETKREGNP